MYINYIAGTKCDPRKLIIHVKLISCDHDG